MYLNLCHPFIILLLLSHSSPEGLDQDLGSSSAGPTSRGRSAASRKHRFDLAARTLLARAGTGISKVTCVLSRLVSGLSEQLVS